MELTRRTRGRLAAVMDLHEALDRARMLAPSKVLNRHFLSTLFDRRLGLK